MVDAKCSVFEPQAGAKPIHISASRTMLESALHALGVGFVVGQVSARWRKTPTLHLSGELGDVCRQSALADAIDTMVTARRLATKSSEAFMAISSQTL